MFFHEEPNSLREIRCIGCYQDSESSEVLMVQIFTLAQANLISLPSNFFRSFSQLALVPRVRPKRGKSVLGSSLGPFEPQSHALLTVPLPRYQYFYLEYQANEILQRFLLVYKCWIIYWVFVDLSSVIFVVSWPLQNLVLFRRFVL